jgi:hypothetical protein
MQRLLPAVGRDHLLPPLVRRRRGNGVPELLGRTADHDGALSEQRDVLGAGRRERSPDALDLVGVATGAPMTVTVRSNYGYFFTRLLAA